MDDKTQNNGNDHSLIENPEAPERKKSFLEQEFEKLYQGDDDSNPKLLDPDAALTQSSLPDTADQVFSKRVYENMVVNELKSLSPKKVSFKANDYVLFPSVVQTDDDGTPHVQYSKLYIKSIPAHIMRNIDKQYEDAQLQLPRKWSKERQSEVTDQDHPKYIRASKMLIEAGHQRRYDVILEGLDMPLEDDAGNVVWDTSKDVRNRQSAIAVLNAIGFTEAQIIWLEDKITNLTVTSDTNDLEAFKKRAMPL